MIYVMVVVYSCNTQPETQNQQVTDTLQWQNHALNVKYTGSKSCQSCHTEVYEQWLQTSKGKAFDTLDLKNLKLPIEKCSVQDPVSKYNYLLKPDENKLFLVEFQLQNRDTVYKRLIPVSYVIGSGNQTTSFLTLNNGFLYELPITYYTRSKNWDLRPGY